MSRRKQFTIIPRNLKTSSEDLATAVRRASENVPELTIDRADYEGGVITVTLPEEHATQAADLLGNNFVLSANTKLNLIE